eukprot:GHVU01114450.1.p1 GENE.GHVU01114450.1~~GHVU01114450.1.p1  ORF type:complete len:150 (+),score=18.49 GHVU01114450.1:26-451(+)
MPSSQHHVSRVDNAGCFAPVRSLFPFFTSKGARARGAAVSAPASRTATVSAPASRTPSAASSVELALERCRSHSSSSDEMERRHEDFETSGIVGDALKTRIERKFGDLRLRQAHHSESDRSVAASTMCVRVSQGNVRGTSP